MFERLQMPFLTVETGEAYQPIRLTYQLHQKEKLVEVLNQLNCCKKNNSGNTWDWHWQDECADLNFESLDSFKKNPERPVRLGSLTINNDTLLIHLGSFKRACLAIPFFYKAIDKQIIEIHYADFINKVFGIDERLPHGFTELFKEVELERIINQRISDYANVQKKCEHATSAEEALAILTEYTKTESHKRLPYAERYTFEPNESEDPDVIFLGFYIYLRGRELVAIRRWFGDTGYTLADAAEETMGQVFGEMNIDIIE